MRYVATGKIFLYFENFAKSRKHSPNSISLAFGPPGQVGTGVHRCSGGAPLCSGTSVCPKEGREGGRVSAYVLGELLGLCSEDIFIYSK